jgi:hypothetical protein
MKKNSQEPKVFSSGLVLLISYIGGPVGATYTISHNLKILGQEKKAKQLLISGVIFTFIFLGAFILMPESIIDAIPNRLVPLTYSALASMYVKINQEPLLMKKLGKAYKKQGIGKSLGVAALSAIFTLLLISPFLFFI